MVEVLFQPFSPIIGHNCEKRRKLFDSGYHTWFCRIKLLNNLSLIPVKLILWCNGAISTLHTSN